MSFAHPSKGRLFTCASHFAGGSQEPAGLGGLRLVHGPCPRLRADPIHRTVPPHFFTPFPHLLPVGSEPLQMMCSDGGERRLEGMGRHKNTHTHTHARTHTLPSPEKPSSVPDLGACPPGDVMTRGEGTCAHGDGTCAHGEGTCARARAGLLSCAKIGASSTILNKKGWREGGGGIRFQWSTVPPVSSRASRLPRELKPIALLLPEEIAAGGEGGRRA